VDYGGVFCLRTRADWSIENRARRRTGTRLIAQAIFALWSVALIVLRGFALNSAHHMPDAPPLALPIIAVLLAVFGSYC
jgi:hypothetical protein